MLCSGIKPLSTLLLANAYCALAFAASNFTIDPRSSLVHFDIARVGVIALSGRFRKTGGTLTLDLEAKSGSVSFTIDTTSIDMEAAVWNSLFVNEGLLNVKKYPEMNFKSNELVFSNDKVVAAQGQFTMLGVTKPVSVSVQNFQCSTAGSGGKMLCSGDISTSLKRSDFGLDKHIPAVSDQVNVNVHVDAIQN